VSIGSERIHTLTNQAAEGLSVLEVAPSREEIEFYLTASADSVSDLRFHSLSRPVRPASPGLNAGFRQLLRLAPIALKMLLSMTTVLSSFGWLSGVSFGLGYEDLLCIVMHSILDRKGNPVPPRLDFKPSPQGWRLSYYVCV
jgi:hypothetical protein